ncbi:MAG: NADH-quinone oxidoreductase subunit C [Planctomycetota bacterium]
MDRAQLIDKLDQIREKLEGIEQTKDNRFYLLCEAENSFAVNRFLFEDMKCRFVIATAIDAVHCYEVLYHFAHDQTGCFLTVKTFIRDKEKPGVESIAQFIPGAMWIEREMHDLMGIEFRNHPDMRRLILADDWPEGVYPLRKKPKNEKDN